MDKGKKQKLIAKIVCLFLSIGLWLYITNVENPMRVSEIRNIPVELINLNSLKESQLALVDGQQFKVDLKVEGTSTEIMNIKRDDFKVVVDMSTYVLKEGENTIPVQILAYPENISIKNNGYLGIKVKLEPYVTKDIPLTSSVKLSFKDHIYEKNQTISPDKVTISGGKSNVEKVAKAVLTGEEKNISEDITNSYKIKFLDSNNELVQNIKSDTATGKLIIEVSKGKNIPIKVNTVGNMPKGYKIESIQPLTTYAKITGEDAVLDNINEIYTDNIDISNLTSSKEISVKLKVPNGITVKEPTEDVKVKVNVIKEELQSNTISCKVNYVNLPEGFKIESSTEFISVTIEGTKNDVDSITSDNVQVTMDLSNISSEGTFSYTPIVNISGNPNVSVSNVENITVTVAAN